MSWLCDIFGKKKGVRYQLDLIVCLIQKLRKQMAETAQTLNEKADAATQSLKSVREGVDTTNAYLKTLIERQGGLTQEELEAFGARFQRDIVEAAADIDMADEANKPPTT